MAVMKSLTIDGVTNVMHEIVTNSASKTINLAANTFGTGASIDLTEPGFYLVRYSGNIPTGATTGATSRGVQLMRNGSVISSVGGHMASSGPYTHIGTAFVYVIDSTITLAVRCISGQTGNGTTTFITVNKIIDMGGVVRHLKSVAISMLYRPRFYGKAVA